MKMKNEKEEYVFRVFQSIAEGFAEKSVGGAGT